MTENGIDPSAEAEQDVKLPSFPVASAPPEMPSLNVATSSSSNPKKTTSKKWSLRLPHQRLKMKRYMLKRQGSSSLQPKHRVYKSVGDLKRVKFILFLKILLHHLGLKDDDLVKQAKAVVLDCIKRQREGKLQETPLISALNGRLFGLVGKHDWEICERYLERYLVYHNIVTEL